MTSLIPMKTGDDQEMRKAGDPERRVFLSSGLSSTAGNGSGFVKRFLSPLLRMTRHSGWPALLLCAVVARAEVQVSAELDRNQIALNEQAVLRLTISGSSTNLPEPQLPGLADFQIYNAGKSQNFSWINGQASASVTYNFVITPLKEGHFTIPAIRVQSGGQTAETSPLGLDVVKGEANAVQGSAKEFGNAPQGNKGSAALFITGTVEKSSVYVGEPVTFIFRLYNRVRLMSNPNYQPPETTGFWSEDLPPQRNYQAAVKGIPYNVTEVKTALFPSSPGKARIGSAALSVHIENLGTDPFSNNFFAQFFGQAEEKVLRTEPVSIHVKPLPEPKPAGFKGAVGSYTLTANVDKDRATVGQPLTLTLTVSGRGNIKSLPDIPLPELTNFRTFDANAATNIEKKDYQVRGSKVFKTVLIPTASGDLTIPAIAFTFFEPESASYRTVNSRAFVVHVAPGNGTTTPSVTTPGSAMSPNDGSAPGIRMLSEDIRYIKTPSQVSSLGKPLYQRRGFRWFHGLIFLLLGGFGLVRLYRHWFLSDSKLTRFRTARADATALMTKADDAIHRSQAKEAASLLADALQGYLSAKLLAEGKAMALKEAMESLRGRGLHAHDTEKVRNLWETLDLFQFAPTQVRPEELRQARRSLDHIMEELEKEISWKG